MTAAAKPRTILSVLDDPTLFGKVLGDLSTWRAWRAVLAAIFGLKMDRSQRRLFGTLAGGRKSPRKPVRECWIAVGRRGGKSRVVSLIASYMALFVDWRPFLAYGEVATIMVIAQDREQARTVFRYIAAIMRLLPEGKRPRFTQSTIELSNGVVIEIHSASFRSTRGYSCPVIICDEIAYWRTEDSANPDHEIIEALRPSMGTFPSPLLLAVSSPYRRAGALWEAYRDYFGRDDDDVLVIQADTLTMHPSFDRTLVDKAYQRDPVRAAAEYGAQFRSDISGFLDSDWIEAATPEGLFERPPLPEVVYRSFCDPSGGKRDAFTLSIAHTEGERAVLDVCIGRRPPFDPSKVCEDFRDVLARYGLASTMGDRYAAEWVSEAFRKAGVAYEPAPKTKSEIYLETGPLFAQRAVELLDNRHLLAELRQLERKTQRGGKDSVDHPRGGHDDHANSAAGALWLARAGVQVEFNPNDVILGPGYAATAEWGESAPMEW